MFYDTNMAAPHRRPRDKGGTDHRDSAAKSFESSNQTMAMFLGGTQKSWMTGHQPTEMPPSSTHTHSHPEPIRQTTISQARAGGSRPQMAGEGWVAAARQDSATIATPGSVASSNPLGASTNSTSPISISKNAQENLDTVLPSPAPSDEPRQPSVHIIDLEEEEPEPLAIQQAQSISGEALNETRLVELAARYGGVDELEKRLSNAEPRNGLPDSADNGEILSAPEDAACLVNERLMEQHEAQSSNGIQQELLGPSQIPPQSALPALMDRRPSFLPRLAIQIPSNADVAAFRTQIHHRLEAIRSTDHLRREIEIPRLGLLEDACSAYDYSYLIMHQLFCLGAVPHLANSSGVRGLAPEYRDGLLLLTHLLLKNDQLPNDAITWFSTFPLPLDALLKHWPSLKVTYEKVLQCLFKLPREWLNLSSQCHHRYYPPLVDEIICMLGVHSTMLQRVICRAVVRDIWVGPQDECYNEVEMLFRQNQQEVGLRGSLNGTPQAASAEAIVSYNQRLAMKYRHVWARHRSHLNTMVQQQNQVLQRGSLSNVDAPMPRPQQMNTDSPTPTNSTIYHNISQSMYPASVSRRPAPLIIDTQSMLTNPTNFVNTPTVPSSPFSGVPVQTSPVTAAARSSPLQTPPLGGVFRPNALIPHSRRRPPRRDFTVPAASHIPSPRSIIGNRTSMHRPINSVSLQVAANSPLQPFFGRHGPAYNIPLQLHVASPVAGRFGHIGTSSPTGQNIPQQFGTYSSLQTHSQTRSASTFTNLSTPNHSPHPQLVAHQPPPVPKLASVPQSPALPLFPPSGHVRSFRDPPNPVPATLHQVHVRSPNLTLVNTDGKPDNTAYFMFVRNVSMMPERLTEGNRHFRWTFEVDREHFQLLAQFSSGPGGAPPARIVRAGSRTFRIRCIKVSDLQDIGESDWVLAETFWPNGIAILLNGIALELRKRVHHGKDLPADITKHVREGANVISVAITRSNENDAVIYALGIETIEITDSNNVHATIPRIEANDALQRIAERSASFDPDIEIVNSAVVVDLTDPFTSCMWELPVRGKACRHNQCFDLNVFLQTRGSKAGHPSAPEQFKCPICGSDARPQMLTVDLFFVKIREELQQTSRLDVKAIILDDQGNWKIKEEDNNGESGDGTGGPTLPGDQHSEIRGGRLSVGQESEIIELDDD